MGRVGFYDFVYVVSPKIFQSIFSSWEISKKKLSGYGLDLFSTSIFNINIIRGLLTKMS